MCRICVGWSRHRRDHHDRHRHPTHLAIETDPENGPPVVYEVEDWVRPCEDYGAFIVHLAVDGSFDHVQADLGHTNDLAGLDRAINALTDVRDELSRLYYVRPGQTGRCLAANEIGRCELADDHPDAHGFPSEEEAMAEMHALCEANRSA